jgi:hypothetical protein
MKYLLIFLFVFSICLVSADVNIDEDPDVIEGVIIQQPEEAFSIDNATLNVNNSQFWIGLGAINLTQMQNNDGTLNILETWLNSFNNNWFTTQTTDDLTEGSTNFYDNRSFNETYTDTLYVNVGGGGSMNYTNLAMTNETNNFTEPQVFSGAINQTGGAVLFQGATGSTPASGAGTRFMWIPDKSSFRAGYVEDDSWDDANIKYGTFASGYGSIEASDFGAFGQGYATVGGKIIASGPGSFAQGQAGASGELKSRGTASFAQGQALGGNITGSGQGIFTQGKASAGQITASGFGSFAQGLTAMGSASIISNQAGSFAQGFGFDSDIKSTGPGSFAQGLTWFNNITASNFGAFAHGYSASGPITASGQNSLAIGDDITATQTNSMALGTGFSNTLANSFQVGYSSTPTITITDGTLSINNASASTYPLEVYGNGSNTISIWAEGNISATGYITRTEVYEGDAFEDTHDSSYYLDNGEINHSKFGKCAVTYEKPIREVVTESITKYNCTAHIHDGTNISMIVSEPKVHENITCTEIQEEIRHIKTVGVENVTEVNLVCWTAKQEQAMSQLNTNINLYENVTQLVTDVLAEDYLTNSPKDLREEWEKKQELDNIIAKPTLRDNGGHLKEIPETAKVKEDSPVKDKSKYSISGLIDWVYENVIRQEKKIRELESEIGDLESEIGDLERRIEDLESSR